MAPHLTRGIASTLRLERSHSGSRSTDSGHRKRSARPAFVVMALLLSTAVPPLQAKELPGVTMPDKIVISGRECALVGVGVRTRFFTKVYVGGLYMAEPSRDERVVISSDQPKRLVLHFLHSKVEKDKLLTAWREGFEKNSGAPPGSPEGQDRSIQLVL